MDDENKTKEDKPMVRLMTPEENIRLMGICANSHKSIKETLLEKGFEKEDYKMVLLYLCLEQELIENLDVVTTYVVFKTQMMDLLGQMKDLLKDGKK